MQSLNLKHILHPHPPLLRSTQCQEAWCQSASGLRRVGVTSEPELNIRELDPDDAFIILASDGVWEFIGNQEAVDIIGASKTVEEGCRAVCNQAVHSCSCLLDQEMLGASYIICTKYGLQDSLGSGMHAAGQRVLGSVYQLPA